MVNHNRQVEQVRVRLAGELGPLPIGERLWGEGGIRAEPDGLTVLVDCRVAAVIRVGREAHAVTAVMR